jgi:hypothetical protein
LYHNASFHLCVQAEQDWGKAGRGKRVFVVLELTMLPRLDICEHLDLLALVLVACGKDHVR